MEASNLNTKHHSADSDDDKRKKKWNNQMKKCSFNLVWLFFFCPKNCFSSHIYFSSSTYTMIFVFVCECVFIEAWAVELFIERQKWLWSTKSISTSTDILCKSVSFFLQNHLMEMRSFFVSTHVTDCAMNFGVLSYALLCYATECFLTLILFVFFVFYYRIDFGVFRIFDWNNDEPTRLEFLLSISMSVCVC